MKAVARTVAVFLIVLGAALTLTSPVSANVRKERDDLGDVEFARIDLSAVRAAFNNRRLTVQWFVPALKRERGVMAVSLARAGHPRKPFGGVSIRYNREGVVEPVYYGPGGTRCVVDYRWNARRNRVTASMRSRCIRPDRLFLDFYTNYDEVNDSRRMKGVRRG